MKLPCSGKGICTSSGICKCLSGYVSANCEIHCSELGGCCRNNADCAIGTCKDINYAGLGYCG